MLATVCEFKPSKQLARTVLSETDAVSFVPMNELGIHRMHLAPHEQRTMSEVIGSYTYFADGDVLLAKITPCFENGKLGVARGLTNGVGFGSSEFMVIRPNDKILPEYLYYFLERDEMRLTGAKIMTGAVGHRRVPQEFIESLEITLPALEEQRRIVALLDEAFAAIDTATANAEKNLANARELFSGELRQLFAGLGASWEWKALGDVADARLGKMLDKRKNKGMLRPYLRNLNVRWFGFDLSDLLEMRFEEAEQARYTALKGDLLIVEGGYPGRCAIWEGDEPIYFQKAVHRVRFSDPRLSKILMYMLFAQTNDGSLKQHFSGSGIQHLTGQALAKIPVPLPPTHRRDAIVARIEDLLAISEEAQHIYRGKLALLDALKQSLLHRAFTGELTATMPETIAA